MAAHVGPGDAPAARLRGPGAGALLRPARALPAALRRGQHAVVANCTTPAKYFHLLRRQVHRNFRKPLIVMTPKCLLRHKLAVSKLKDFAEGSSFHRVLWDDADLGPEYGISTTKLVADDKIKRVVLCSGKVYYDLLDERDARGIDDVYLMRLEQFYPWPALSLTKELGRFKQAEMVWCQEEPKNHGRLDLRRAQPRMGARPHRGEACRARYVGRPAAASPATGLAREHKAQQAALVDDALNLKKDR